MQLLSLCLFLTFYSIVFSEGIQKTTQKNDANGDESAQVFVGKIDPPGLYTISVYAAGSKDLLNDHDASHNLDSPTNTLENGKFLIKLKAESANFNDFEVHIEHQHSQQGKKRVVIRSLREGIRAWKIYVLNIGSTQPTHFIGKLRGSPWNTFWEKIKFTKEKNVGIHLQMREPCIFDIPAEIIAKEFAKSENVITFKMSLKHLKSAVEEELNFVMVIEKLFDLQGALISPHKLNGKLVEEVLTLEKELEAKFSNITDQLGNWKKEIGEEKFSEKLKPEKEKLKRQLEKQIEQLGQRSKHLVEMEKLSHSNLETESHAKDLKKVVSELIIEPVEIEIEKIKHSELEEMMRLVESGKDSTEHANRKAIVDHKIEKIAVALKGNIVGNIIVNNTSLYEVYKLCKENAKWNEMSELLSASKSNRNKALAEKLINKLRKRIGKQELNFLDAVKKWPNSKEAAVERIRELEKLANSIALAQLPEMSVWFDDDSNNFTLKYPALFDDKAKKGTERPFSYEFEYDYERVVKMVEKIEEGSPTNRPLMDAFDAYRERRAELVERHLQNHDKIQREEMLTIVGNAAELVMKMKDNKNTHCVDEEGKFDYSIYGNYSQIFQDDLHTVVEQAESYLNSCNPKIMGNKPLPKSYLRETCDPKNMRDEKLLRKCYMEIRVQAIACDVLSVAKTALSDKTKNSNRPVPQLKEYENELKVCNKFLDAAFVWLENLYVKNDRGQCENKNWGDVKKAKNREKLQKFGVHSTSEVAAISAAELSAISALMHDPDKVDSIIQDGIGRQAIQIEYDTSRCTSWIKKVVKVLCSHSTQRVFKFIIPFYDHICNRMVNTERTCGQAKNGKDLKASIDEVFGNVQQTFVNTTSFQQHSPTSKSNNIFSRIKEAFAGIWHKLFSGEPDLVKLYEQIDAVKYTEEEKTTHENSKKEGGVQDDFIKQVKMSSTVERKKRGNVEQTGVAILGGGILIDIGTLLITSFLAIFKVGQTLAPGGMYWVPGYWVYHYVGKEYVHWYYVQGFWAPGHWVGGFYLISSSVYFKIILPALGIFTLLLFIFWAILKMVCR